MRSRLPDVVVVGAMKCGTSALHRHLDSHPDVAMSTPKELNFFFGGDRPPPGVAEGEWWRDGQWHRGTAWYAAQLDPRARVRGESSPGYTDPSHPEVAARMRAVVPDVRLVYLVREPFDRAWSQWSHHRRDRSEPRSAEVALLDPASQYLARSRYRERLAPFREQFPDEQLLVVVQERLARDPETVLGQVFAHVGVDPAAWWTRPLASACRSAGVSAGESASPDRPGSERLRADFRELVADDAVMLRAYLDDDLPEWSLPRDRALR